MNTQNRNYKALIKLVAPFELFFLLLGVSLPLATIDEFWFFSSEFSVLSLSYILFINNEYILAFIIIFFGLIVPAFKIVIRVTRPSLLTILPLQKFAMLDVFLLSFLIFGGKLSYFYEVTLQFGFYFMLSSIILGYLAILMATHKPNP